MKRLKTYFRLAILFVSGINPALPGYSWAQAGQVIHGVYLDDTLVIVYTLLLLLSGGVALVRTTPSAVRFALGIIALGTLGVISAHVNAGRAGDLGEALRLYYLAVYFVVAVDWALEAGPHAILRPYLLGAMIGAMLNVGYSIAAPELTIFTMPTLRLGNGAGGFAGFSIWLAAWLWLIRRTRFDAVLALAATGIFTVAMIMSFSKTSVTMGTCGLAAWAVVLLYGVVCTADQAAPVGLRRPRRGRRRIRDESRQDRRLRGLGSTGDLVQVQRPGHQQQVLPGRAVSVSVGRLRDRPGAPGVRRQLRRVL